MHGPCEADEECNNVDGGEAYSGDVADAGDPDGGIDDPGEEGENNKLGDSGGALGGGEGEG